MLDGIERTGRYDSDIYGIYREEIPRSGVDKIADNLQRRLECICRKGELVI